MKRTSIHYIGIFKKFKVLVIGDLILDVYLKGACTRIAPEGTFPVIDLQERKSCLGGAGNVAANLKALGCTVLLYTATGDDAGSKELVTLLNSNGISHSNVVVDDGRTTLVKTRIAGGLQTVVRLDQGTIGELSTVTEKKLIRLLREGYANCDAVLIADYKKGIITPGIRKELARLLKKEPKFLAVDAKELVGYAKMQPSLVKPNYNEVLQLLCLHQEYSGDRAAWLSNYGEQLYGLTGSKLIAVTLDFEGSLFFEDGKLKHRSYAPRVAAPQVSGAGDTFMAAGLLALLAGATVIEAAELATAAAALVVGQSGTAVCEQDELLTSIAGSNKSIPTVAMLKTFCRIYRNQGKRIVFTNGCFDILHSGHVSYLSRAKERGDILIVGVNTDESIRRLKGNGRPVNLLAGRSAVLSALNCVDHVISFGKAGDDTPISLISAIRPTVFVKGGDYQNKVLPEGAVLKALGCEVVFLPYVPDQSTTRIITKIEENVKWKIAVMN